MLEKYWSVTLTCWMQSALVTIYLTELPTLYCNTWATGVLHLFDIYIIQLFSNTLNMSCFLIFNFLLIFLSMLQHFQDYHVQSAPTKTWRCSVWNNISTYVLQWQRSNPLGGRSTWVCEEGLWWVFHIWLLPARGGKLGAPDWKGSF